MSRDYEKLPPGSRLGDAPISPEYAENMKALGRGIDAVLNGPAEGAARQHGFILMVFPYGDKDGARCNYLSNGADRRDVVAMMKEMIARFEGQPEISGSA